MAKKNQVEFFAFTFIPELGGWVVILQQRNNFNSESETGYKKQSYANGHQATFCEKAEPGEEIDITCLRGAKEELGEPARNILMQSEKNGPQYAGTTELNDKIVSVYTARVPSTILKEIRSEVAGRVRLITREMVPSIIPMDREKDKAGVSPNVIAMFPDALENLQKAFVWLDKTIAKEG